MFENFVLPKFVNPNLAQTSWGQAELGSSTWNQGYHGWNHLSRSEQDENSPERDHQWHWQEQQCFRKFQALRSEWKKHQDVRGSVSISEREKHMIVQVQEWKGQWEIEEWKDDRWRVWLPQCSLGSSPCQQTLRCHCWKVWWWQLVHCRTIKLDEGLTIVIEGFVLNSLISSQTTEPPSKTVWWWLV